jgi:hypothetical protein
MINPKTGKVAPHPSSHVKRGESASSKNTSGDSTSDSVGLLRHIILILGVFGAPLAIWYVL